MRTSNFLIVLVVLFSIASCKTGGSKESVASDEFVRTRDAFFLKLVSPREAAAQLQATGAEFNSSLMNDPALFSRYVTSENKAAVNLGIYLADLNYCTVYKQSDFTKKYFDASRELGLTIGIEKKVLEFIGKRYVNNIYRNDSLREVFSTLYSASTTDLQASKRERVVGVIMAAYTIENLHIALGIIQTYPKDILPNDSRMQILVPVFQFIFNQRDFIVNIYSYLKAISNAENPNTVYYANAFAELIETYDKLNVQDKILNNKGAELLNDEVVKRLADKVDNIRNKAISSE
jgi:hypothetical protein